MQQTFHILFLFYNLKFNTFLGSILSTPKNPNLDYPTKQKGAQYRAPPSMTNLNMKAWEQTEKQRVFAFKRSFYISSITLPSHIHTSSFYLVLVKIWVSNFNVTTSSHSMVLFSSAWFEFSLQVFIFVNSIWFFRTFLLTGKENGKISISAGYSLKNKRLVCV